MGSGIPVDSRIDHLNVEAVSSQHGFQLGWKCFAEKNAFSMYAAGAEGDDVGRLRPHCRETERPACHKKRDHLADALGNIRIPGPIQIRLIAPKRASSRTACLPGLA